MIATSGGFIPPPTSTSSAMKSAARQRLISPRRARAVTPTIAGQRRIGEQPHDLRLRVERHVHIEEVRAGARDARDLVQPRRHVAQAVVHREEAREVDPKDDGVLRVVLRDAQCLRQPVGPSVRRLVRIPVSGVLAEMQRGVPRVEQLPQKLQWIDVQRGLTVVELHAAAVAERNQQRERDEERRNSRFAQAIADGPGRSERADVRRRWYGLFLHRRPDQPVTNTPFRRA